MCVCAFCATLSDLAHCRSFQSLLAHSCASFRGRRRRKQSYEVNVTLTRVLELRRALATAGASFSIESPLALLCFSVQDTINMAPALDCIYVRVGQCVYALPGGSHILFFAETERCSWSACRVDKLYLGGVRGGVGATSTNMHGSQSRLRGVIATEPRQLVITLIRCA